MSVGQPSFMCDISLPGCSCGFLFDKPCQAARSGTTRQNTIGISNGCAKGRGPLWDKLTTMGDEHTHSNARSGHAAQDKVGLRLRGSPGAGASRRPVGESWGGLGVSQTPVREAIARLEPEGLVPSCRGAFVTRKTKSEILEMITVWAALESMAARLITENATDEEIASLQKLFATVEDNTSRADIDGYSDLNIRFHQAIIALSKSQLLATMTETLFIHTCSIRERTIGENDLAQRSIIDHMNIITALEDRDADLAERLSREHTLVLTAYVEKNVTYLD